MKTRSMMIALVPSLILMLAVPSAFAHEITRAKAAELALHRVERLVILKKIEDAFQGATNSVSVELISHTSETQPAFKSTVAQYPGANGTQKKVEIVQDAEGKALSFTVLDGADAAGAPVWPDKDAVTLSEDAFHYVIDNAAQAQIAPYSDKFTRLTLKVGSGSGAQVDLEAEGTAAILRIRLKTNGDFESAEVVN